MAENKRTLTKTAEWATVISVIIAIIFGINQWKSSNDAKAKNAPSSAENNEVIQVDSLNTQNDSANLKNRLPVKPLIEGIDTSNIVDRDDSKNTKESQPSILTPKKKNSKKENKSSTIETSEDYPPIIIIKNEN